MAKSLNKCQFIGNLGRDPEIRYAPSGGAIANMSLACSSSYKDKNTGETVDTTEWVRLVAFNKLAEICGEYLAKGAKIYVEGKMRTRKWQDKDGQDKYTTEVVIDDLLMLDTRGTAPAPSQHEQAKASGYQPEPGPGDFDDDIPF